MNNILRRIVRELKKNSLKDFIKKTSFYYFGKGRFLWALDIKDWEKKKKISGELFSQYPVRNSVQKKQIIVFVIPGVWISGGVSVILHHANMLKERGYGVFVVTQDLKTDIPWYSEQKVDVIPMNKIWALLEDGIDILVATGWNSAPTVDFLPARRKLYFVQSDERQFYDDVQLKKFVGKTYEQPFEYVTMAKWIAKWLYDEFGHSSKYVPNGLDTDIFKPAPSLEKKNKFRVLIEGPVSIPFKGVENAYNAVKDIDCDIWMASSNGRPPKEWKIDRFFEKVPLHQMPGIYSSCDVLLKMSTVESFSYPPLEMMACGGVPIILNVTGIEEYAVNEKNCLVIHSFEEAKNAVERLMRDDELRETLILGGLETAKNWGWKHSADALEQIIVSQ